MDVRELGCEGVEWLELTQDRVEWWAIVNLVPVMNLWVP
jgi:hypothetical protein